jgi:hypothetical protein
LATRREVGVGMEWVEEEGEEEVGEDVGEEDEG